VKTLECEIKHLLLCIKEFVLGDLVFEVSKEKNEKKPSHAKKSTLR